MLHVRMADALLLYDAAMKDHDPGRGHPERPERLGAIEAMLGHAPGGTRTRAPQPASPEIVARVHAPQYVDRIGALRGRAAGLDPDTSISPGSVDAAFLAAGAGRDAVDAACGGEHPRAFALVRPPGHHAETDRAMGFCLFNNIAVAAAHAIAAHGLERVLVIDWDVHHGNGTQSAFYERRDVLFFSTHQFPFYPGTGSLREQGRRQGEGFTVNVPMRADATDGDFALAFREVLMPIADQYAPELVLVSAGFDAHADDPLAGMRMSDDGFAVLCDVARSIADRHAGGKLALLLEGGYDVDALERCTLACASLLAGATAPSASANTTARGEADVRAAIAAHGRYWRL
jgi:acetoin utilization deacetylase AcuC-like enzyme